MRKKVQKGDMVLRAKGNWLSVKSLLAVWTWESPCWTFLETQVPRSIIINIWYFWHTDLLLFPISKSVLIIFPPSGTSSSHSTVEGSIHIHPSRTISKVTSFLLLLWRDVSSFWPYRGYCLNLFNSLLLDLIYLSALSSLRDGNLLVGRDVCSSSWILCCIMACT